MPGIQLDSNVTTGPIVAADSQGSTMYPLSKLAFGAIGTFTLVTDDTAGAFPVKPVTDTGRPLVIRGLTDSHVSVSTDSGNAVHVRGLTDSHVAVTSDSGNPVFVRGLTNSGIDVIVDSGDLIRIANDTGQAVPVRGATDSHVAVNTDSGNALHVRGLTDSHVAVTGDTGNLIPVRGATDSHVPVLTDSGNALHVRGLTDSTVAVSGTVAVSSITIDSGDLIRVANDTGQSIPVRGLTDSHVAVTGDTGNAIPVRVVGYETSTSWAGNSSGVDVFSNDGVSSAAVTVSDSASRLFGYYIFNADTATVHYVNLFADDSAGVTLGTTVPRIHVGLPPLGAANLWIDAGIYFSSGISVSAVTEANDTGVTGAGANEVHVVLYYKEA